MLKELQIINQQEVLGKEFKIYGTIEQPLFLAKDVAEWIDYNIVRKAHSFRCGMDSTLVSYLLCVYTY